MVEPRTLPVALRRIRALEAELARRSPLTQVVSQLPSSPPSSFDATILGMLNLGVNPENIDLLDQARTIATQHERTIAALRAQLEQHSGQVAA